MNLSSNSHHNTPKKNQTYAHENNAAHDLVCCVTLSESVDTNPLAIDTVLPFAWFWLWL